MSKSAKLTNAVVVDKCTQRLHALKTHIKNGKTEIPIDGVPHKATEVMGIYQTCLDTRAALSTKRSETKAAMGDRAGAEVSRRAADRALKGWVINTFGASSQQALDFGFPPSKVSAPTPEKMANAVKLRLATREARHTMGPKKKAEIKGTLPVPTAPAAPATPTVPAAPSVASTLASPVTVVFTQAPPPQPTTAAAPVTSAPAPVNGVPAVPVTNGASH